MRLFKKLHRNTNSSVQLLLAAMISSVILKKPNVKIKTKAGDSSNRFFILLFDSKYGGALAEIFSLKTETQKSAASRLASSRVLKGIPPIFNSFLSPLLQVSMT